VWSGRNCCCWVSCPGRSREEHLCELLLSPQTFVILPLTTHPVQKTRTSHLRFEGVLWWTRSEPQAYQVITLRPRASHKPPSPEDRPACLTQLLGLRCRKVKGSPRSGGHNWDCAGLLSQQLLLSCMRLWLVLARQLLNGSLRSNVVRWAFSVQRISDKRVEIKMSLTF
jgi:hypothetical protein